MSILTMLGGKISRHWSLYAGRWILAGLLIAATLVTALPAAPKGGTGKLHVAGKKPAHQAGPKKPHGTRARTKRHGPKRHLARIRVVKRHRLVVRRGWHRVWSVRWHGYHWWHRYHWSYRRYWWTTVVAPTIVTPVVVPPAVSPSATLPPTTVGKDARKTFVIRFRMGNGKAATEEVLALDAEKAKEKWRKQHPKAVLKNIEEK
jgi:hypothetical protein